MTQIKKMHRMSDGVQVYPQTHTKAVIDDNGYTAESRLQAMQDEINAKQLEVGAVPSDLAPIEGSSHYVTSDGLYKQLNFGKENVNINLSEYEEVSGWIGADIWSTVYKGIFIPVTGGQRYRITGNAEYNSRYAFLTSNNVGSNNSSVTTYANNATVVSVNANEIVIDIAPDDANYIWVGTTVSVSGDRKPQSVYEYNKKNIPELFEEVDTKIAQLPENKTVQEDSDLDIVDDKGNILVRFASGHVKTKNFDSENIVVSNQDAEYRQSVISYPVDVTKAQHIGQINVQKKVAQLCNLHWTPIRPMPSTSIGFTSDGTEDTNVVKGRKYYRANTQITGIPYSSTGINGKAIGSDISIETFMTALKNPNSVLYTIDIRDFLSSNLAGSYYGNNCSSFTNVVQGIYAICKGRNNNYAGNRILRSPKNADALQIGDIIYLQKTTVDSGHAVIVYQIDKDENGYISRIHEAEEDSKKANIYSYTKEQFVERFFKGGYGYVYGDIYRNIDLVDNVDYEDFDEDNYQYSEDVALNLGNNTNYNKKDDMPIEVSMLSLNGFSIIYNNAEIASYTPSDGVDGYNNTKIVTIDKGTLSTGRYEVRPTNGVSQYFNVCSSGEVVVSKNKKGDIVVDVSGYSSNVIPYAVLFVSSRESRTTRGLYLMNGQNSVTIPADWFDFVNTTNDIAYLSVVYRNECGNIYSELISI